MEGREEEMEAERPGYQQLTNALHTAICSSPRSVVLVVHKQCSVVILMNSTVSLVKVRQHALTKGYSS